MINSRDKGKKGELEIKRKLREYGYDARRGQQFKGGPDSPDVIGLPGIHIEVKRVERLNIYDAMLQSKTDAAADEIPVVMHRRNNHKWLVTMSIEDFMAIYQSWELGDQHQTDYCDYINHSIAADNDIGGDEDEQTDDGT